MQTIKHKGHEVHEGKSKENRIALYLFSLSALCVLRG